MTKTPKCKAPTVRVLVRNFNFYVLDGETPTRAAEIFKSFCEDFEGREVTLEYYHDDDEAYLAAYETRPETEIERDRRLESERAALAWRRRQFEQMKKEFGET